MDKNTFGGFQDRDKGQTPIVKKDWKEVDSLYKSFFKNRSMEPIHYKVEIDSSKKKKNDGKGVSQIMNDDQLKSSWTIKSTNIQFKSERDPKVTLVKQDSQNKHKDPFSDLLMPFEKMGNQRTSIANTISPDDLTPGISSDDEGYNKEEYLSPDIRLLKEKDYENEKIDIEDFFINPDILKSLKLNILTKPLVDLSIGLNNSSEIFKMLKDNFFLQYLLDNNKSHSSENHENSDNTDCFVERMPNPSKIKFCEKIMKKFEELYEHKLHAAGLKSKMDFNK